MSAVNNGDVESVFRQYLQSTGNFTNKAALDAFTNDKAASDFMRSQVKATAFDINGAPVGNISEKLRELNTDPMNNALKTAIADFSTKSGLNPDQVDLKAVPGSLILRSRYDVTPDDAADESIQQQIQDSSFSDFFSFVPPNGELGFKNSLFLQNRQHEKMVLYDSNIKASSNIPNTLGFHSSLDDLQYVPVLADLREIEKSTILRTPFKNLSGIAALPGSNMINEEPFSDEIRSSFLIPGEVQPGVFTRDNFSQPLAADFNNYVGMKPYYDQMRYPLNPSFQPTAQRSKADMLIQAYMLGPQIY
jgi:hypothetical protein